MRSGRSTVVVLFLPPALLLFTLFVVMPVMEAGWYSFFNWNGYGRPTNWVGLAATRRGRPDPRVPLALRNNGLIIVVSLLMQLPLALTMAVLLAERFRGAVALRMLFFLPYILAEIAAGLIWRFVYDGDYGLLGRDLARLRGRGAAPPRQPEHRHGGDPRRGRMEVLRLPHDALHRGAAGHRPLAGRGRAHRRRDALAGLRYVVIPCLYPTIRLSVFFAIVGSLQLFDVVMPLTQGGPADTSQTMVSFLYTYGFTRMRVGSAARSAWSCS